MLKVSRLCIPVGMACNIECQYCYRNAGKSRVNRLTDEMRDYIRQLDPSETYAVCCSGGEPLLYWGRCKEIFELVPKDVHRKVMTNGVLLTQEIVDYCNTGNIEVHLSHDGAMTKELRGVDVLRDPKILELAKQIKILRIFGVCTALNPDPMECYRDTVTLLGRTDFLYDTAAVFHEEHFKHLIEGFDYEAHSRGLMEYFAEVYKKTPYYRGVQRGRHVNGINVMPDGTVCGMTRPDHHYGTINDSLETIQASIEAFGDNDYCNKADCHIKGSCSALRHFASDHTCKVMKIRHDVLDYLSGLNQD